MSAKKRLDDVFSIYIRNRDTPGRCISCGKPIHFNTCDAGHYIPRQHLSTRWDERNVNAQCRECNRMYYGNLKGYTRGLMYKYGNEIIDELFRLKNTTLKLSQSDYKELIKKYR